MHTLAFVVVISLNLSLKSSNSENLSLKQCEGPIAYACPRLPCSQKPITSSRPSHASGSRGQPSQAHALVEVWPGVLCDPPTARCSPGASGGVFLRTPRSHTRQGPASYALKDSEVRTKCVLVPKNPQRRAAPPTREGPVVNQVKPMPLALQH
jgi:hypothetical protein